MTKAPPITKAIDSSRVNHQAPRLAEAVGAVEPDAQALDAARCEIERKHEAEGQHVAAPAGEDRMNLLGDRFGDLLGPGFEDDVRRSVGERARCRRGSPAP